MISKETPLYNSPTDATRCRASVSDGDRMMSWHQCYSKAKHDGKWCSIHRPGAAEERAAKRGPTRSDRDLAAIHQRQERTEALEAEVKQLQGDLADVSMMLRRASRWLPDGNHKDKVLDFIRRKCPTSPLRGAAAAAKG